MHYCKYRASRWRALARRGEITPGVVGNLLNWDDQATAWRNVIVSRYATVMFSWANNGKFGLMSFEDQVAECLLGLITAAEDYPMKDAGGYFLGFAKVVIGFKIRTARRSAWRRKQREPFRYDADRDPRAECVDKREEFEAYLIAAVREILQQNRAGLEDDEREAVMHRFGFTEESKPLISNRGKRICSYMNIAKIMRQHHYLIHALISSALEKLRDRIDREIFRTRAKENLARIRAERAAVAA